MGLNYPTGSSFDVTSFASLSFEFPLMASRPSIFHLNCLNHYKLQHRSLNGKPSLLQKTYPINSCKRINSQKSHNSYDSTCSRECLSSQLRCVLEEEIPQMKALINHPKKFRSRKPLHSPSSTCLAMNTTNVPFPHSCKQKSPCRLVGVRHG